MPKLKKQLLSLSVQFTILTPDQLKEIKFGLIKKTDAGVESWKITFALSTREAKTDPLVKLVDAVVDADFKYNELAEETATDGLNKPQTDHLTLNVATAGERFNEGKIKEATFKRTVKATLPARNA
jgi:hypothetical protein